MSTKTDVEVTTKQNTEVTSKFDQLLTDSKKLILERTIKNPDDLKKLLDVYGKITIKNIDSKAESNHVETGLKELRKIRIAIDKNRKDLTAPATEYQKSLIAYVNPWLDDIDKTEKHLEAEKQKYIDLVKAEKDKLFTERAALLAENGFQLQNGFYISGPIQVKADSITEINQQEIDYYVSLGKQELERKSAELEREQKLNEKEAKINKLLAELDQKNEELNQKIAELEAQKEALELTYKSVEGVENVEVMDNLQDKTGETQASLDPNVYNFGIGNNENGLIDKIIKSDNHPIVENSAIDIFAGKDPETPIEETIIPEEISEYQRGFNDCRIKVLEILKDPNSFGKKIATLKEIVTNLEP
jgi:hypothetical protein